MGKLSHWAGKGAPAVGQTDLQEGAKHIQFTLALQRGISHEPHHSWRKHLSHSGHQTPSCLPPLGTLGLDASPGGYGQRRWGRLLLSAGAPHLS